MTLYAILGGLMALALCAYWFFRTGRKDAQADVMQQVNDDAFKATQVREDVARMAPDAVRDALRDRLRKSG